MSTKPQIELKRAKHEQGRDWKTKTLIPTVLWNWRLLIKHRRKGIPRDPSTGRTTRPISQASMAHVAGGQKTRKMNTNTIEEDDHQCERIHGTITCVEGPAVKI